ncbi:MAG: antibiotic biosynthesis monooxygenase [Candidatus Sericytochromatia bacterium]
MITFGLNYDVKPEFVSQFLDVSRKTLAMLKTLEGHVKTVLYSDVDQPDSFMIYSEWETDEHFKEFMKSEAFKGVQNMTRDMLVNRPRHKIYETKNMERV